MKITKSYLKDLVYKINGAAIEVHKELGPGLLESVYHRCMEKEFTLQKIKFQSELKINVDYKGLILDTQLRCDFLVEDIIVVELKAVEYILPVHKAQIISYMKLLEVPEGVLINFNVANIYKDGQKTYVNELFTSIPE